MKILVLTIVGWEPVLCWHLVGASRRIGSFVPTPGREVALHRWVLGEGSEALSFGL